MGRRLVWVLGVEVTMAVALSVPSPAAAALPDRDNVVTAAEVTGRAPGAVGRPSPGGTLTGSTADRSP